MKKTIITCCFAFLITLLTGASVYADVGDLSFFGGISRGRYLPGTTEQLLEATGSNKKKNDDLEMAYKEIVFLSGEPVEFEGLITVSNGDNITKDKTSGTYDVKYAIKPGTATNPDINLTREITYNVKWRREGKQIIKDFTADTDSWSESIAVKDKSFSLDEKQSYSSISIIEDQPAGVVYYKGNSSHKSVYTGEEDSNVTLTQTGTLYGYSCAWSSTETHRIDGVVDTPGGQMQFQVRPSVSVGKTLRYSENEPTAISFSGNYMEVMSNQSGLTYDIYISPREYRFTNPTYGTASIDTFNTFEQLIAPNTSFLKGHYAESDITKLFSMKVLEGDPKFYQPSQSITRGQFITALVKAVKLPTEAESASSSSGRNRRTNVVNVVFPDVLSDRAEYPYIMAAYKAELAVGREDGKFYIDAPIERQEAIVILLRTLGLENLGLDPTPMTAFTDDSSIASWAKKEVSAAYRLRIISGDEDGCFRPRDHVSKAEAAALVNRMIEYMRSDLKTDYTEHIVNFSY